MTYSNEDSFKVEENEDGSLSISWDPNDPRYSFLNGKSEEELNEIITNMLEDYIAEISQNDTDNSGS